MDDASSTVVFLIVHRPIQSNPLSVASGVGTVVITSAGITMTKQTTIRAIGNSAGTTIPKSMLERYHLAEGDSIHLVETEEGILITPFDPAFAEAMEIYSEGAKRYRNAMRQLAK
jgi:putative addiction module antidote